MTKAEINETMEFAMSFADVANLRKSLKTKLAEFAKKEILARFTNVYDFGNATYADLKSCGWTYEKMCDRLLATEATGVKCA